MANGTMPGGNKNKQPTSWNATLNFRKISNSGNIIRNPSTLRVVMLSYFVYHKTV